LVFFIAAVSAFVAGEVRAQGLQKVPISYSSGGITSIDLFIAREKGFFGEEGLEAQLIQMRASTAIAAGIAGDVEALGSIGSAIRSIQRGAPLRVVAVTLHRPLFWLISRPEYRSVKDLKGKVLGVVTIGGRQHTMAKRMLALGGIDADKGLTTVQVGEESVQLQALISNAIQAAAISPPIFLVGRDKYKMNILDGSADKFTSIQNGLAVHVKTLQEKPELVKKMLRARAKGNRFFHENEKGSSELLALLWNTDLNIAGETYRLSKPAFTLTGIPSEEEIKEYLALDAQILKLPEPVPPSKVFDFALQREVIRELGIK
jgi:ABC-type nitrate/sulfonate/bicarbonate transport system substrate-binding protein